MLIDGLIEERDRWMGSSHEFKAALSDADHTILTMRMALGYDPAGNGWTPPHGVDPAVDLALGVREERDRLRASVAELELRLLANCCGVCGCVCESGIRDHIAKRRADGDTHDDEIMVAWRLSTRHPWNLHGSWRFWNDTDFAADESIGWAVRQHLRSGAHDVRVLYRRDAEHLCDIEPGDARIGG